MEQVICRLQYSQRESMASCIVNHIHRTIVNWLHSEEVGLERMKVKRGGCVQHRITEAYLASCLRRFAWACFAGASEHLPTTQTERITRAEHIRKEA